MLVKYKEYIPFLYEIKNIAEQRSNEYNSKHPDGESVSLGGTDSTISINDFIKRVYNEHDPVKDYLMNVDFDTVKIIQTVMYIGRDYNGNGTVPVEPVDDGDNLIDTWMRKDSDWKFQSIEVSQIAEKMPLGEYLTRAFTILGI